MKKVIDAKSKSQLEIRINILPEHLNGSTHETQVKRLYILKYDTKFIFTHSSSSTQSHKIIFN